MAPEVQSFDTFNRFSKRVTKMPVNPMDKSTVVSIYPDEINDFNSTIFPGSFHVDAAKDNDFEITLVGPSSWWKELGPDEPFLEISTNSMTMADGFIKGWATGLQACNMGDRMPGLFYVPGEHSKKTLLTYSDSRTGMTFTKLLETYRARQNNWFAELVRQADIMWARTNGSPTVISKQAKMAAMKLGMVTKVWLADSRTLEMAPCPACGEMINHVYPVCRHCKNVINKEKAKAMDLKFAV